jgi:hypothetical protein
MMQIATDWRHPVLARVQAPYYLVTALMNVSGRSTSIRLISATRAHNQRVYLDHVFGFRADGHWKLSITIASCTATNELPTYPPAG